MKTIINGIEVSGTPKEIAEFTKLTFIAPKAKKRMPLFRTNRYPSDGGSSIKSGSNYITIGP